MRLIAIVFVVFVAVTTAAQPAPAAQDAVPLAIPSEFVRELAIPGSMDRFLRPGRIFYDSAAGELYVADQGNNRIVIFNREGTYRFEFALAGRVGSIIDFAVSPDGYVYVLGSAREGRKLLQFDFDGLFLGELLDGPGGMAAMNVTSMTIGSDGDIHLLDESVPQLVRVSPDGSILTKSPILRELDDKTRMEMAFGSLSSAGDALFLPLSSLGTVYRYTIDGQHTTSYGYKGSTTGELNFPVSATMTGDGMVLVLDKQRYNVLCFTESGEFVGEFGGKGISPGWFYLPSYLAADEAGQVFISQVFLNRVQACRVPGSIQGRFEQAQSTDRSPSLGLSPGNISQENQFAGHTTYQPNEGGSQ